MQKNKGIYRIQAGWNKNENVQFWKVIQWISFAVEYRMYNSYYVIYVSMSKSEWRGRRNKNFSKRVWESYIEISKKVNFLENVNSNSAIRCSIHKTKPIFLSQLFKMWCVFFLPTSSVFSFADLLFTKLLMNKQNINRQRQLYCTADQKNVSCVQNFILFWDSQR